LAGCKLPSRKNKTNRAYTCTPDIISIFVSKLSNIHKTVHAITGQATVETQYPASFSSRRKPLWPFLTFNPGWSSDAQPLAKFADVRELQRQLKDHGVQMVSEADESSTGPASFMVVDPDGNPILVDQHV
jgi:hypothetical protein